ncbi:hypothetical protein LZ480_16035 [Solibacillus sp. MA9]|uniref:Uncharacterized protein n=1 Tax=Solibacillus palustris TaxID=2908203 RepID=A0ABS9UGX1_9BACL|nr:hypothetical protein [Solibacillus sp. MA9]MCH7323385.1 hypothetical protein [Solibacillus sp. MA9]
MNFHRRIVISMLFLFIDFNINGFDIIPDFIGYVIVAFAFSKLTVPYAAVGMYCAVPLMINSFVELFLPKTQGLYLYEPVAFPMQVVQIAIGLLYIFYLACIFSVSKEIVPTKKSIFPKLFIGLHLLTQLLISVGIHLNINEVENYIPIWIFIYLLFYVFFFGFLWRREYIELELQQKNKQPLPSN